MVHQVLGGGPVPAADSRRAELLRIAGDVFAQSGYTRTALRDVADAAGILAGSLYHHFPSKESLAIELISAFHADLDRLAGHPGPSAPDPMTDPLTDLVEFAAAVGRVAERHRAALHMCMYDAPSTATDALSELVRREPASLDRRWADLLDAAALAGAIRPGVDLAMLRFVLRTAVLDLALLPGVGDLRALVESLTALLLRGLAASRPSFSELDASVPSRVARDLVSGWTETSGLDAQSRRGEILAAARREFARRGYEATTIRDVAQVVGIRPSSLYRHFASKQEILEAIMERFSRLLLAGYRAVVGSPGSAAERMDAVIALMTAAAGQFWPEFVIVKDWWRSLDPPGTKVVPADNATRLRLLESVVDDGIGSGQFQRPRDPALLTLALRSTLWIPLEDPTPASAASRHELLRLCVFDGAATPGDR